MWIKITLKKIKRGDILKINWIDAGDINDVASSWFSEETAENVFKEIPVETIAVYFGHGKETLFLVRDTEDIKLTYYNGACVIPIEGNSSQTTSVDIPKHRLIPDESYKKFSDKEKYDHEMKYEYYFRHCPLHLKYTPELYLRGRLSPIYPSFATPGATHNKK